MSELLDRDRDENGMAEARPTWSPVVPARMRLETSDDEEVLVHEQPSARWEWPALVWLGSEIP